MLFTTSLPKRPLYAPNRPLSNRGWNTNTILLMNEKWKARWTHCYIRKNTSLGDETPENKVQYLYPSIGKESITYVLTTPLIVIVGLNHFTIPGQLPLINSRWISKPYHLISSFYKAPRLIIVGSCQFVIVGRRERARFYTY